jgi:hypothetical protein
MFKYQIHALAMRKLGLGRPFRVLMLLIILGCFVAGVIYSAVVFQAVVKRSHSHHVQPHTTH